jgi:hypothetical protein
MREKLGEMGCSSFALIKREIVASAITYCFLKFITPIVCMYLSKIPEAMNKVSPL